MSEESQLRRKALDVLSLMRGDGMSLAEAARLVGIEPADVRREVGAALEKRGSRWRAKPWDRLRRLVRFLR
jgi:predicted transcriptional regulator with HTH domain